MASYQDVDCVADEAAASPSSQAGEDAQLRVHSGSVRSPRAAFNVCGAPVLIRPVQRRQVRAVECWRVIVLFMTSVLQQLNAYRVCRCERGVTKVRKRPTVSEMDDSAQLVARIESLLRSSQPPADVLEDVARALKRGAQRGGQTAPPEAAPATSGAFTPTASHRGFPTQDLGNTAKDLQLERAREAESHSLQGFGKPDVRALAARARYEVRNAAAANKPVNDRERKIAQYQALLEGRGGKYTHADFVDNGATQIAGTTTYTPSMTAVDGPKLLGQVKGQLSTRQYCNRDNAFNMRF